MAANKKLVFKIWNIETMMKFQRMISSHVQDFQMKQRMLGERNRLKITSSVT